jgi:hypothetical protein
MRKTLTVLATVATVAVAAVAAPTGAEARWGGRGAGLFGGLIVGGLIAGALAPRYYGGYGYPGYNGYYDDGPYCWRRRFNGWRYVHYRVC